MGVSARGSTSTSSTSTRVTDGKTAPNRGLSMSTSMTYLSEYSLKKQRNFVGKLFNRQISSQKEIGSMPSIAAVSSVKGYMNGIPVTECPYIRPLAFKLVARDERKPKSSVEIPRLALPEKLSTDGWDTNKRPSESDDRLRFPKPSVLRTCKSQPIMRISHDSSLIERIKTGVPRTIEEQRQDVAIAASPDSSCLNEWLTYLRSYSEGRFNLTAPPNPPPHTTNFKYLPAICPPDEEERIAVSRDYDIVWPHWDEEKAGALIAAALKRFDTRYAAISFFDDELEIFKAENGYNTLCVPRESSIAAHVLLSADTFAVLDTAEDWRFAQNPLVTGHPKIRFFAGTPLLAPGGEVVGVFALFDKNPRDSFTRFQKRELAEFGQLAIQDLNLQAQWLSDPDVRSTPIFERNSLINADTQPFRACPPTPTRGSPQNHTNTNLPPASTEVTLKGRDSLPVFGTGLVPQPLRYHKVSNSQALDSLCRIHNDHPSVPEPTPPSSSGSGVNTTIDVPRGFGKNHKKLSVKSGKDSSSLFQDLFTPNSDAFHLSSPRPFSSSDITSLFPHPPNTPEVSLGALAAPSLPQIELTVENFMSLTDFDCAEPGSLDDATDPLENTRSREKEMNQRPLPTPPTGSVTGLRKALRVAPAGRKHESISTDMSNRSSRSCMSEQTQMFMAEAAFSCSFTAQAFGYDLVYAARVEPTRLFMSEEDLARPGGVRVKIVVAYGLQTKIRLDAALHFQALRSNGWKSIEHVPGYQYKDDEFEVGHIFRMSDDDGPIEKCRSGLVFGAFRRPNNKHIRQTVDPAHQRFEVERLMNAASALNTILSKAASRRSQTLSLTQPNSPTEQFPAHEAAEL